MTSRVTQKVLENNKSYLPCATSSLDPKVKQAEDLPLGSRSDNIENNNWTVTAVDKAAALVSEQVLEAEEEAFFALFIGAPLAIGLFSGSMWKSRVFPNWVTYVGLAFIAVDCVGLLLIAFGVVVPGLGFGYLGLLVLWILASSVYLYRSDRKTATTDAR